MTQLESQYDRFKQSGVQPVVIAAQQEHGLLGDVGEFVRKQKYSFPLLLDTERTVCKAYGVHHLIGLDAINIARPSAFVVDRQGRIQFLFVGENQKERVSLDALLAAVKDQS
jgi:peroxiredoxin